MTQTLQALSHRQEAAAIKEEWARGVEPDTCAALSGRPELRANKSVVLELAYEEYCLRCERGQRPNAEAFCDRFPTYRLSVRRLVAGHQFLLDNIEELAKAGPVRWPEPGERLGDFVLLRELGRGAFARVYLAAEESTGGRPVAVKVSPEGAAEARTLGRLAHPNIVPVLSARFEESAGLMAVCMPYLGAATLTDVFDQAYPTANTAPPRQAGVIRQAIRAAAHPDDPAPLAAPQDTPDDRLYTDAVARLGGQIADALAFLHLKGVCHRDLKPSNVLINPSGQALLLDFNLSIDARHAAPRLGGTLPYMPPEQLRALIHPDERNGLDERVDLYALGAILYELLTGKLPHGTAPAGLSTTAAVTTLLERQRTGCVPLRTLNPAVDRGLARLIERCLALDQADRPASAASLAADFRRYLAPPARLRRAAARRPWVLALAAVLLVLMVGGAAFQLAASVRANGHGEAATIPSDADSYRQGRAAFVAGNYARAEELFGQAIADAHENPKPRDYYLAHAAAALRLADAAPDPSEADYSVALADVDQAVRRQADGETMALMGYCNSRSRNHEAAAAWYDRAAAAGFTSAALLNDRGLSSMQRSKLPDAQKDFDAALAINPHLRPALFNRIVLFLRQRSSEDPPPIADPLSHDLQEVLEAEPPSQELYFTAAQFFAAAAQDDGSGDPKGHAQEALSYVQKAVALGLSPDRIREAATLCAVLKSDPAFQTALASPPRTTGRKSATLLVDPAPYIPGQ